MARAAVAHAVNETDIASAFYRPIGELSKGFRQRVGLAAAILHRPELLILDEPTEGLDPNQRADIRQLVANLGRERTVVLSTHVLSEVESTCTRLLVLSHGKLVAQGTVAELRAHRAGAARYVVELVGDDPATHIARLAGVSSVSAEHSGERVRLHVEAARERELGPEIFALARDRGWTLWELHREEASLEHLFRALTTNDDESRKVTTGEAT
jgi:ABC-2 type transport system ATP-binding protein